MKDTEQIERAAIEAQASSECGESSILTVDELASLLRINRDTAYKALAAGQIPGGRKIRGVYRINREAVLEWLNGNQRRSERQ